MWLPTGERGLTARELEEISQGNGNVQFLEWGGNDMTV